MPSERGEYRPIYVALLDGPDFQALNAEERWVLVTLKLSLGMLGIAVLPGLESAVAERTGYSVRRVSGALRVLEAGWVEREKNVAWLVRGFKFEPSMSPSNQLHRTSVRRLIEALPRLAIVERFKQAYGEWFDNPIPYPLDSPSIAPRNTETETQTEPETEIKTPHAGRDQQVVNRVREALPEPHRDAFTGLLRTCQSGFAFTSELEAIASGMRNIQPLPTWEHIGQALSDLVLNGQRPTAVLLRSYVQRLVRGPVDLTTARGIHNDTRAERQLDEYELAARRLEEQERAHAS